MKSTHSDKLERWLGLDTIQNISSSMQGWYGPPIPVANVPGGICATKDGDFIGNIGAGSELSLMEFHYNKLKKTYKTWERNQKTQFNAGFSSVTDLMNELKFGKRQIIFFKKTTAIAASTGNTYTTWRRADLPPAASVSSAGAPGGTIPSNTTTGALPFVNPNSGDTAHIFSTEIMHDINNNVGSSLLLYDRIFAVEKTMNSTATEAVTGVPTRYQSTTPGATDSAEGNFLFIESTTNLAATAHNWTVCKYTDQSGNAGAILPSLVGTSGNGLNRLDHPVEQWFAPLASGDTGIKALTQMQCDALIATGSIEFVIGHPIAFMPPAIQGVKIYTEMFSSSFNLTRIFDNACLSFLEINKYTTASALTYTGSITIVSG